MKILFNNKVYDFLKWVCIVGLYALSTLYSTLAGIWGLPYKDEICQTLAAVGTCLGAMLGLSTTAYKQYKNLAEKGEGNK